jgi:hypothetical protein
LWDTSSSTAQKLSILGARRSAGQGRLPPANEFKLFCPSL